MPSPKIINEAFVILLAALVVALCWPAPLAATSHSTADHGKFQALQGPFGSGPDVTRACLSCHTEADKQLHKTVHWTWEYENAETGQTLGKKHVVNNFCTAVTTNEEKCNECHISYSDKAAQSKEERVVDCLVCHDTTGAYSKKHAPDGAALAEIAGGVGRTSRQNCGACHFSGGGGHAVKHGDLDKSLIDPDRDIDVHMDYEGLNFSCSTCHRTQEHSINGSRYAVNASDKRGVAMPGDHGARTSCRSCHGERPMKNQKLLDHIDRIACQTCHIPEYARGGYPTKVWWDWSTAGKRRDDGKPYMEYDPTGLETYNGMKGDFRWDEYAKPEYRWFNGVVRYTTPDDEIDPTKVVPINQLAGSPDDPDSRIWPFKVMRGRQVYDAERNTLAVAHLWGEDEAAFWTHYDWDKSLAVGMAATGREYSGKMGFVDTEMSWPLAHMVAPKTEALGCPACHTDGGALEAVEGVYIPGRDKSPLLDIAGFGLLGLTVTGTLGHGLLRMVFHFLRKGDRS